MSGQKNGSEFKQENIMKFNKYSSKSSVNIRVEEPCNIKNKNKTLEQMKAWFWAAAENKAKLDMQGKWRVF